MTDSASATLVRATQRGAVPKLMGVRLDDDEATQAVDEALDAAGHESATNAPVWVIPRGSKPQVHRVRY